MHNLLRHSPVLCTLAIFSLLISSAIAQVPTIAQAQPTSSLAPSTGSAGSAAVGYGTSATPTNILKSYVSAGVEWTSRGLWYNIVEWAARTSNCAKNATSVACMACSMDLPAAAVANGVAPIAVANKLWFESDRGAVCGMCLKVYMLNGTTDASPSCPNPKDPNSGVSCAGYGSQPYIASISDPLNYGAKIMYDPVKGLPYFIAMAIEWLDRNQTDQYTLAYPTQKTQGVDSFGSWPIIYEGTPCPGADKFPMEFQFLDFTKNIVTYQASDSTAWLNSGSSVGLTNSSLNGGGLCNNLAGQPCGTTQSFSDPLTTIKLAITGNRIPIGAADILLEDGKWYSLERSGDGYWETKSSKPNFIQNPSVPVDVRVTCVDGTAPLIEKGLVPSKMLCQYQDPLCQRFTGTIQC